MIKGSSYGETVSCLCTPNLLLFSFFSGRAVELAILTVVWIHVWTNQSQHNPTLGKVNLCMDAVAIWILLTLGALSTLPVFIWDRLCFSHLNMLLFFLGGGSTSHSSINERDVLCTDTFFISLLSCFCLQCHCEIQKIPLKKGVYERLTNIIFTVMDSFVYHPSTWMPLGECWCVRMYASVHLWGWSFIAWALLLFVSACVMHT